MWTRALVAAPEESGGQAQGQSFRDGVPPLHHHGISASTASPESHLKGFGPMVLGSDSQCILQEAQGQVILHHTMQHQPDVVLGGKEGAESVPTPAQKLMSIHSCSPNLLSNTHIQQCHLRVVLPEHKQHEVAGPV